MGKLGIGRLHPDLVKIVGQLRYRYSYAQNILRHSVEVAHMCGLLAQEICRLVAQILTDWQAVQKKLPAFKVHAAVMQD